MTAGVIVSRQAGTAAAFHPLLRLLRDARPDLDLSVFCYPDSRDFLPSGSIIERFGDARETLDQLTDVAFVLTGTSEEVAGDALWWSWSRQRGVRSVAFVDQWVNYWQRFTSDPARGDRFNHLPDCVAVVDGLAKRRLEESGLASGIIVETGTPVLDDLFTAPGNAGERTRARYLKDHRDILLLYACEGIWPDDRTDLEFLDAATLERSLALCCEAAGWHAERGDGNLTLLLKPHPRQILSGALPGAPRSSADGLSIHICDHGRVEMLHAADIVLGAHSMPLYEASMLGKPAISIQPDKKHVRDLTDGRAGIDVVTDIEQLKQALGQALDLVAQSASRPRPAPGEPSHARRFLSALDLL
ncbi:MAG: hypothetical protein ACE5EM_00430 [Sphingomonadales bacterium]